MRQVSENAGFARLKNIRKILQEHVEPRIRLVTSIPVHGFLKTDAGQRQRNLDALECKNLGHHYFNHREQGFAPWEGHFNIDLCELRLAVGAQVLIAKALHDLEIFFETGNHQNLFEQLRRLR